MKFCNFTKMTKFVVLQYSCNTKKKCHFTIITLSRRH
nr:MAG TPA: hypothetical protein [Caudoviricetes sp.]